MSFQNHIKQVAPRLSQIKSRQPAMLLGNKVVVAGIGGNFIPGTQSSSDSTSSAIADISAGYITVSDSIVTLHDLTKGTTSIADKIYIPDTGMEEPDYAAGGTPQPVPASMDFYKCSAVYSDSTWSGYKAVLNQQGYYEFQSESTEGLVYSVVVPSINTIYSTNALIKAKLYQGSRVSGAIFYASLQQQLASAQTGQNLVTNGVVSYGTQSGIQCGTFTTNNSYITSTITGASSSQISFSLWVYLPSGAGTQGGGYPRFFSLGNPANSDWSVDWLCLTYTKSSSWISFQFVDNNSWATSKSDMPYNTWIHVACTFNNNLLTLYINGQPQAAATATNTLQLPTQSTLYINRVGNPNAGTGIDGVKITAFRIYNRVLTQAQINTLASQFTPTSN